MLVVERDIALIYVLSDSIRDCGAAARRSASGARDLRLLGINLQ